MGGRWHWCCSPPELPLPLLAIQSGWKAPVGLGLGPLCPWGSVAFVLLPPPVQHSEAAETGDHGGSLPESQPWRPSVPIPIAVGKEWEPSDWGEPAPHPLLSLPFSLQLSWYQVTGRPSCDTGTPDLLRRCQQSRYHGGRGLGWLSFPPTPGGVLSGRERTRACIDLLPSAQPWLSTKENSRVHC